MGSTPRSIQSLLHTATSEFSDVLGRARFLERIRDALMEILPVEAAPHVRVAAYDRYRLRLHVAHASWATRLRYMQPAIAQALAQRLRLHIETVEIRVRPLPAPAPTAMQPRHISAANRSYIRRVADHIDHAELADAMARLAAAGTPRQTDASGLKPR